MKSSMWFDGIYPNELLYGAVSRIHLRVDAKSMFTTLRYLFDGKIKNIHPLFLLYSPFMFQWSKENLGLDFHSVFQHTLDAFAMSFLTKSAKSEILGSLQQNRMPFRYTGLKFATLGQSRLMYCPLCFQEDLEKYGEPYWHRDHQIMGLNVCMKHKCMLEKSTVNLSGGIQGVYFANYYNCPVSQPTYCHLSENALRYNQYLLAAANAGIDVNSENVKKLVTQVQRKGRSLDELRYKEGTKFEFGELIREVLGEGFYPSFVWSGVQDYLEGKNKNKEKMVFTNWYCLIAIYFDIPPEDLFLESHGSSL